MQNFKQYPSVILVILKPVLKYIQDGRRNGTVVQDEISKANAAEPDSSGPNHNADHRTQVYVTHENIGNPDIFKILRNVLP